MSDRNNHKGFPSKSLAITERRFFFALTVRGRSSDWILNVRSQLATDATPAERPEQCTKCIPLPWIREFSISKMSLIDIKNSLTMGINFSTPIFLLESRNIVKTTILFTWNNGTNLAASASFGWLWSVWYDGCWLVGTCLVPRPHYYPRPMRFGSRGPRKFLRRLPAVRLGYVTEMHWPRGPGKTPYRD